MVTFKKVRDGEGAISNTRGAYAHQNEQFRRLFCAESRRIGDALSLMKLFIEISMPIIAVVI